MQRSSSFRRRVAGYAGDRNEPHDINVEIGDKVTNCWLDPIRLQESGDFKSLAYATSEERSVWRLIGKGQGIHWHDIDEDLSVEGLLSGKRSGESQASFERWIPGRQATQPADQLYVE